MTRLFTALALPGEAVSHLEGAVFSVRDRMEQGVRWVPSERWHVTLRFHGEDDPQRRAVRLRRRAAGLTAPTMRLAGAGTFGGVLWVGVRPADDESRVALRALVRAAGGDPHGFRAHLTVARWSTGRPDRAALTALLADYVGPWWAPDDIVLVNSELRPEGPRYTDLERVSLEHA